MALTVFRFVTVVLLIITLSSGMGQQLTLDDLLYIQRVKSSLKIDELLKTKDKWDCACYRKFDKIERNTIWLYDVSDLNEVYPESEKIEKITEFEAYSFSSVTHYFTTDKDRYLKILDEIKSRRYDEEGVVEVKNDSINARLSFYITPDIVIESMHVETQNNDEPNKFSLFFIDKKDYLNGLKIK